MTRPSGLDIDRGNLCSRRAYAWAKKTFATRDLRVGMPIKGLDGSFSNLMNYGQARIAMSSDGVGTKIELAERTGIYDTIGHDLVAMVVDDLAANGVEPTNISNILDVDVLDEAIVDALMGGLHDAARIARVAVVGGEIAELGARVSGYGPHMHFNWSATGIGILPVASEPIDGKRVRDGDAVIALLSRGFRSNGFSLVRRIMADRFGTIWHKKAYDKKRSWGEILLTPSRIFAPAILALRESDIDIHGIAHITGGGIPDNLSRILASQGLGADLDDLPSPPAPMRDLQHLGDVPDDIAYRLWNMGVGMLLACAPDDQERVIDSLSRMDFPCHLAGHIRRRPGISIASRGLKAKALEFQA